MTIPATSRPTPKHRAGIPIERLEVLACSVPTDAPESDGTFEWQTTSIIIAIAHAGDYEGLGYTYSHPAAAHLIRNELADIVCHYLVTEVEAAYVAMRQSTRNIGREGIAAAAVSAVDIALWDLKARWLGLSLVDLIGACRTSIPVYGSGGFTSYSNDRLSEQLGAWAHAGFPAVKMKVGREPSRDRERVRAARAAIGPSVSLFVDANGALTPPHALAQAESFAEFGVTWFEEPVSSDDLEGLRSVRNRAPAGMDIAAGEYGFDLQYFRRMASAGAVDVLQADATRCGGVSGFMRAAALCDAWALPLSSHTAPSVHAHLCCAASRARHLEYFHDHVRIESLLFDGVIQPRSGSLAPDRSRAGLGVSIKRDAVERFVI